MKFSSTRKKDFLKKAAFIADKASCNYKVGCVGVTKDYGQKLEIGEEDKQYIRRKRGLLYVKSWNATLHGEIYCQTFDGEGKRICIREVENLKGREYQKVCSSHAEIGLIARCAKYGIPTNGMVLFITNSPCYVCAKALIQAGFTEIYYIGRHPDDNSFKLFKANGIKVEQIKNIFS